MRKNSRRQNNRATRNETREQATGNREQDRAKAKSKSLTAEDAEDAEGKTGNRSQVTGRSKVNGKSNLNHKGRRGKNRQQATGYRQQKDSSWLLVIGFE